jgi:hypothetical protein
MAFAPEDILKIAQMFYIFKRCSTLLNTLPAMRNEKRPGIAFPGASGRGSDMIDVYLWVKASAVAISSAIIFRLLFSIKKLGPACR